MNCSAVNIEKFSTENTIEKNDIKIKKRYTQSYQAQKKLYKFCKTNNSKIKNLNSPIYINGNNSPLKNAEIIYEKIYQNII